MLFSHHHHLTCPYCLTDIHGRADISQCPKCKADIPVQYVRNYGQHPPFLAQIFGWTGVGKTVFLSALTLMLVKMGNVWPNSGYSCAPATDASQRKVMEINDYLAKGLLWPPTPLGPQEAYIMILHGMERWGGRALVLRDCAGEIFDNLRVPVEQAPYLLNAPTSFMLISLPDLPNSAGRSMDMLLNNYINTLLDHRVDLPRERRKLVVVFTKADSIMTLPANLRDYVVRDPLWAAVAGSNNSTVRLDAAGMAGYLEEMGRVSDAIRDWIQRDAAGKNFVQRAHEHNIELRFCLISSTGSQPGADNTMPVTLSPRRVLDPFFWALELQSRP